MSNLLKLKKELEAKKSSGTSSKTVFKGILGAYLGKEPKPYYPKAKGADGKAIKTPDGKDVRETTQTGVQWTFSELLTNRTIMVVLPISSSVTFKPELLEVYTIQGLGFDLKQSNMVFIDEKGSAVRYE